MDSDFSAALLLWCNLLLYKRESLPISFQFAGGGLKLRNALYERRNLIALFFLTGMTQCNDEMIDRSLIGGIRLQSKPALFDRKLVLART